MRTPCHSLDKILIQQVSGHVGSSLFWRYHTGTEHIVTNKQVKGHVFILFSQVCQIKGFSTGFQFAQPFSHILEKSTYPSKHTHFIIVPQNQWNFIDFTGSIVLEYNFRWKGLE
jgi:hypothetical protein